MTVKSKFGAVRPLDWLLCALSQRYAVACSRWKWLFLDGHLLDHVRPGDMVVADRAYASYFLLAALAERGAIFVIRPHQRRRSDQANARRLGAADHLVSWPKAQRPPWMAYSTYARLPDHLTIREERIICHVLPSRPDRVEPRANKRRPKQQRYLNQPRDIARQALQEA